MDFNEVVQMIKGSCSRQIFSSFGYDDTRKKYTALETSLHNNADLHPSMGLHQSGDSFFLKDFAGEQKKYSSIDLIMISEGLRFLDAVRRGAEICGISIDDNRREELSPDKKFIVKGLYAKAERDCFSVKEIVQFIIWALSEKEMCAILHSWETIEPKAALPLLYFAEGSSSPQDERKEGDAMYVTYQDLIQIGILVVALANLIYQIYKGKKK